MWNECKRIPHHWRESSQKGVQSAGCVHSKQRFLEALILATGMSTSSNLGNVCHIVVAGLIKHFVFRYIL